MVEKVFVFGCPGSGKSTAARILTTAVSEQNSEWAAFHISDYGLLDNWFRLGSEPEKFRSSEYGGFEVVDASVYNRALLNVKDMILDAEKKLTKKQIIVIEFARPDYWESLALLGEDFIQDAYFLLIDAEVDTCEQRILKRIESPETIHDHFVPGNVLTRYREQEKLGYLKNVHSHLKEIYGIDDPHCMTIDNSICYTKQDLSDQITKFVSSVIKDQQSQNEQCSNSGISFHTQIVGYEYQDGLIPKGFAYSFP